MNSLPLRDLQILYRCMGLTDKAQQVNKKLAEIDPFWAGYLEAKRPVEEAEKSIQEFGRYPSILLGLAKAHYQIGNYKDASKIIQELETLYEKERDKNAAVALAGYFSETIHDKNKSLTWLERAVQKRAPTLIGVGLPVSFTFIQKEPRFQEVLKKVGLK